ncbi:hypothetical protein [Leeuwenhoekiella sp. MAR_2009_132]|nr:hypothetical protein [Leeuwenhoekiella sp. MAR_2009_132]
MSKDDKETKNDKKEKKSNIDKGPLKDKHVNQYGNQDDNKDKKRGA